MKLHCHDIPPEIIQAVLQDETADNVSKCIRLALLTLHDDRVDTRAVRMEDLRERTMIVGKAIYHATLMHAAGGLN